MPINPEIIRRFMAYSRILPRSVCVCGHTGDGADSDHASSVLMAAPGHGGCSKCPCTKFSWDGFTREYQRFVEKTRKEVAAEMKKPLKDRKRAGKAIKVKPCPCGEPDSHEPCVGCFDCRACDGSGCPDCDACQPSAAKCALGRHHHGKEEAA